MQYSKYIGCLWTSTIFGSIVVAFCTVCEPCVVKVVGEKYYKGRFICENAVYCILAYSKKGVIFECRMYLFEGAMRRYNSSNNNKN